ASYPGQGIVVTSHSDPGQPIGTTLAKLPGYLSDHPGAVLLLGGYNDLANACNTSACKNAAVSQLALGVRDCIKYAKEHGGVQFVFVSTLTPPGPSGQRRIAGDLILQANAA